MKKLAAVTADSHAWRQPPLPAPFAAYSGAKRTLSILVSNVAIFAVLHPTECFVLWMMRSGPRPQIVSTETAPYT